MHCRDRLHRKCYRFFFFTQVNLIETPAKISHFSLKELDLAPGEDPRTWGLTRTNGARCWHSIASTSTCSDTLNRQQAGNVKSHTFKNWHVWHLLPPFWLQKHPVQYLHLELIHFLHNERMRRMGLVVKYHLCSNYVIVQQHIHFCFLIFSSS